MSETFLTLEEVAEELRESIESVRTACVRYEMGKGGGLRSYHFGNVPVDEAKRKIRKVLREDLDAFIESRRLQQRAVVIEQRRETIRHYFRGARRGKRQIV